MLDDKGNTAVYLLYAYTRIQYVFLTSVIHLLSVICSCFCHSLLSHSICCNLLCCIIMCVPGNLGSRRSGNAQIAQAICRLRMQSGDIRFSKFLGMSSPNCLGNLRMSFPDCLGNSEMTSPDCLGFPDCLDPQISWIPRLAGTCIHVYPK